MTETLIIAEAQAKALADLSRIVEATTQQLRQAERERDLVLMTICAGHGVADATAFSLTGNQLTVTLPDPPKAEDDGA